MKTIVKGWLAIWLYVITVIGAVIGTLIVYNWNTWDWNLKLTGFAIIALILHVLEEWRFPGGFHFLYNTAKNKEYPDKMNCYPMNQLTDMLTNMIPIIIGCVMMLFGAPMKFSLMWFYLCLTDTLGHLHMGVTMKKKYAVQGKKTIYNPGLGTSIYCFLPVFSGFILSFVFMQAPLWSDWVISIIGVIIMHVICLLGPEKLFADVNSPYVYDWGKGYFEKFEYTVGKGYQDA